VKRIRNNILRFRDVCVNKDDDSRMVSLVDSFCACAYEWVCLPLYVA